MSEPMDRIVIEVESNSTDAVNGLDNLRKSLKKLQKITQTASGLDENGINKVEGLANALGRLSEVGSGTNMAMTLRNLRKIAKLDFSNLSSATSAIHDVASIINPSGNTGQPTTGEPEFDGTIDVPPGTEEVDDTNSSLSKTKGLLSSIGNILKNDKTQRVFAGIGATVKRATESLRAFLNSLKRIALYRAIRAIISAITNSFKEGVNAVYQYSKALGGTFAKSMDSIATSMNYMKASLGAMSAPILNMLAPAIEYLTDRFVDFLNVINQVFARLSGANTWTRAIKVQTEYAEATDAATQANKKLKQSFLGIDEINALKDNSGSDTSSASSYQFEEVPLNVSAVDKTIDKLKVILTTVLEIKAALSGWDIAKFVGQLAGLEGGKLSLAGLGGAISLASLTIEVAGLVDIIAHGVNWKNFLASIGGTAGAAGGGAIIGAAFGSAAIGAAIGAIVGGLGLAIAGIWSQIKDGFDWLTSGMTVLGTTLIGLAIGSFFGPWGLLIGAAIGLVVGLIAELVIYWDEVCAWASGVWDWFYSTVVKPIADFFVGVATWFYDNVIAPIVDFFAPIVQALGEFFALVGEKIWEIVSGVGKALGAIFSKLWEIFLKILEIFGALAKAFYDYVLAPVFEWLGGIAVWVYENVLKPIGQFFANIGTWVYDHIIKPIWDKVIWLRDKAIEVFKVIGTTVVNFVSDAFKTVINGVLTGVEWVINKFIGLLNGAIDIINLIPGVSITKIDLLSIPRLAEGGQVENGQLFIAREAGAELVGNIGGKTSVANNDQIIEGISNGVREANGDVVSAIVAMAQQIIQSVRDKDTAIYLDGDKVSKSVTSAQNRTNRMYGATLQKV